MQDYYPQIELALVAAKYHEDAAFKAAEERDALRAAVHLRAYFWELQSVWDYTLLHANSRTLKLKTQRVRADFLKQLQAKMADYMHLGRLQEIAANESLKRISLLRNEAHRFVIQPTMRPFAMTTV